jgi:hypothetical protein
MTTNAMQRRNVQVLVRKQRLFDEEETAAYGRSKVEYVLFSTHHVFYATFSMSYYMESR